MAAEVTLSKNLNIQYFKDFLSDSENKNLLTLLRSILGELCVGLAHSSVYFLRVIASNANSVTNFNQASVTAELHRKLADSIRPDIIPIVAPLALFFTEGYVTLVEFLDKYNPKVPEKLAERQALRNLIQFLSDNAQQDTVETSSDADASLARHFVQHLLGRLVPDKTFVIDGRWCFAELSVTVGDTSFGCPGGWYGHTDILLKDDEVPVTVVEASTIDVDYSSRSSDIDNKSVTSEYLTEVKKGENFSPQCMSQVLAQTMVNSFIQNKKNPNSHKLIPGIGICSQRLIIYLYDSKEDILLSTGPIDLKAQMNASGWNYRAIIMLWLVLNYNLFGNDVPQKFKQFKSNLHHVLGPVQLETYMNKSEHPFKVQVNEDNIFKFFSKGIESVNAEDDVSEYFIDRQSICLNSMDS